VYGRPCKTRKVKCDETKPGCNNCAKQGEACDYSIRLNWEGRGQKKAGKEKGGFGQITFDTSGGEGSSSLVGNASVEGQSQSGFGEHGGPSGLEHPPDTSAPTYEATLAQQSGNNLGGLEYVSEHSGLLQAKRPNSEPPFFVDSEDEEKHNDISTSPRPHKRAQYGRPSALRSYASEMLPPPTSALNSPYSTHIFDILCSTTILVRYTSYTDFSL
jgi:hypothetical protein